MAHTVLMPQLGVSEESAILTAWHVKQGETVRVGQKLFSIETGKSSFDVESEHAGTVLALFAAAGDEVAVKTPVCAIGEPEETIINCQLSIVNSQGVSPRAKHLAAKMGVDPAQAAPTGPEGRVIERDIRAPAEEQGIIGRAEGPTAVFTAEKQPLSHIRRMIAKTMMASLQNSAQLTHTSSFDATSILDCRKRFKADPETAGVNLTDMILYTVSRTLPSFPALNAHLRGDVLWAISGVHLAVAADTERGLMVPVVFDAQTLTLLELSRQVKTLAGQCRDGSIPPERLIGGSFTVSNLGPYGIESFTPILNPPQTGILGVNAITTRVRERDGRMAAYPAMALSLTYDHRAIDGAPASRFLQALCKRLEAFSEMEI